MTPTPPGVPVKITSPVFRVTISDRYLIISGMSKIRSFVLSFCLVSSFTLHTIDKLVLSSRQSGETM